MPPDRPGAFEPNWESLEGYRVPDWYADAKFGIFIHWGPYCVPAFSNEWYPRSMYDRENREVFEHHRLIWGPHDEFGYKDFIPLFKAERWDPAEWAELFEHAGARFVVPVAEHHDGFAMYDSGHTEWNSVNMGPKRDIVGNLAKEIRRKGMKLGASSHFAENLWFFGKHRDGLDTADPANWGLYNEPHTDKDPIPREHLNLWLARTQDIVERYRPELIWFDWWIEQAAFEPYLLRFASWYYNKAKEWSREAVINYKNEAFRKGTAVLDIERGKLPGLHPDVWQTDTSVSRRSWGFIESDEFRSVHSLLVDLADIVSKNGVLLLNIGPKPDGTIPKEAETILGEIGRWLKLNGEAIYGTRPWKVFGEGPTAVLASGSHTEGKEATYTGQDVRFTRRGNTLYVLALAWPGPSLRIPSLGKAREPELKIGDLSMLGYGAQVHWERKENHLEIWPPASRPGDYVYAFKMKIG